MTMSKTIRMGLVLVVVCLVGAISPTTLLYAQVTTEAPGQWEYRVLTKDLILDLGNKDLTTGLNRLGSEGWELITIEPASISERGAAPKVATFYFKRPRNRPTSQAEDLKDLIERLEFDHGVAREWAAWTERMARKGFRSESQVTYAKQQLKDIEVSLEKARRQLRALSAPEPIKAPAKVEKLEK
jgi:hypothetical protein